MILDGVMRVTDNCSMNKHINLLIVFRLVVEAFRPCWHKWNLSLSTFYMLTIQGYYGDLTDIDEHELRLFLATDIKILVKIYLVCFTADSEISINFENQE